MQAASQYAQTQLLLQQLPLVLQQAGLWSDTVPSRQALASEMPFACDTLRFEQWLQFIFLPKMTRLVQQQLPLPKSMAILPMAEETLGNLPNAKAVLALMAKFDRLLGVGGE